MIRGVGHDHIHLPRPSGVGHHGIGLDRGDAVGHGVAGDVLLKQLNHAHVQFNGGDLKPGASPRHPKADAANPCPQFDRLARHVGDSGGEQHRIKINPIAFRGLKKRHRAIIERIAGGGAIKGRRVIHHTIARLAARCVPPASRHRHPQPTVSGKARCADRANPTYAHHGWRSGCARLSARLR